MVNGQGLYPIDFAFFPAASSCLVKEWQHS
jgi:hypothetical protein